MTYSYQFANPDKTFLRRTGGDEEAMIIPCAETNRFYRDFLESGAAASDYVAPADPTPLTAEQKLANAGLTVDELKALLGI